VDNHVKEIHHHPRAVNRAVPAKRAQAVFLAQLVGDFLHDGAQMRLARAGGDDKIIRHRRQFAHVEDDNVLRLFVVREIAAELGQFF
jgi:hypothetical protein